MSLLPRRRKRERFGTRPWTGPIRCPGHLQWVRGHDCAAAGGVAYPDDVDCAGDVEAAHVRLGTDGGTSQKPGDNWAVPLCKAHHREQHQQGEVSFWDWQAIGIEGAREMAQKLWLTSPHGKKYRARQNEEKHDG